MIIAIRNVKLLLRRVKIPQRPLLEFQGLVRLVRIKQLQGLIVIGCLIDVAVGVIVFLGKDVVSSRLLLHISHDLRPQFACNSLQLDLQILKPIIIGIRFGKPRIPRKWVRQHHILLPPFLILKPDILQPKLDCMFVTLFLRDHLILYHTRIVHLDLRLPIRAQQLLPRVIEISLG